MTYRIQSPILFCLHIQCSPMRIIIHDSDFGVLLHLFSCHPNYFQHHCCGLYGVGLTYSLLCSRSLLLATWPRSSPVKCLLSPSRWLCKKAVILVGCRAKQNHFLFLSFGRVEEATQVERKQLTWDCGDSSPPHGEDDLQ